jgi:16S rRNA (cytosine967-C5)-methyltransferase
MPARDTAVQVLLQVTSKGRSLAAVLPELLPKLPVPERGLCQELSYGTLRWQPRLEYILKQLLTKPLKGKERDIHCLLLIGLYQLDQLEIPHHVAVSETVAVAKRLKKEWARGLVNAVLRRFLREREQLLEQVKQNENAACAHPGWLLQGIKKDWPDQWHSIIEANNARPPMTLRVNRRHHSRQSYLEELQAQGLAAHLVEHAADAITLERPVAVERLPGFNEGRVSVQDAAAQLAAGLLQLQPGQRVLDACAAPGGKSGHILELCPEVALTALDLEPKRLTRVAENLERLQLEATLVAGDAGSPAGWWDGKSYDRILLDAPCSATGVIRRHPDIKLLRRADDIAQLAELQGKILKALWPLLKPGGLLLYATCSIFKRENEQQLANFLADREDSYELPLNSNWGQKQQVGRQILPGQDGMDGFYYACLKKV